MMKFLMAAVVAMLPVSAFAGTFTGPRIEATASVSDITRVPNRTDVMYGANAGIDAPLFNSTKMIVGAEVTTDNIFDHNRTYGVAGRVGYIVNPTAMLYAKAGYTNFRTARYGTRDGLTVGGGLEVAMTQNVYGKIEYRYSDLDKDVGRHQGLVGVGLRF